MYHCRSSIGRKGCSSRRASTFQVSKVSYETNNFSDSAGESETQRSSAEHTGTVVTTRNSRTRPPPNNKRYRRCCLWSMVGSFVAAGEILLALFIIYSQREASPFECKHDRQNNSLLFFNAEERFHDALDICSKYNATLLTIIDLQYSIRLKMLLKLNDKELSINKVYRDKNIWLGYSFNFSEKAWYSMGENAVLLEWNPPWYFGTPPRPLSGVTWQIRH